MLRHKVFFDGFDAVDRSVEKREVLPKFKKPVKVEYVRNGDMSVLVNTVNKSTQVLLSAAVGAGKSTRIPAELSKCLGRLVIHTIPFHIAARALAEYIGKQDFGEHVYFVDDLHADLPQQGVVITTNGYLHARLALDGLRGVDKAILYLDEIHESDAATAVMRAVAPALSMFSCVVKATATLNPGEAITPRLPGERVLKRFPRVEPRSWSAGDKSVPWSASEIRGNTAIVVDRKEVRDRLRMEYSDHGFDVRVLLSSSDYEYYRETMRRLVDPTCGIVIILCDYAYRSSFSIPNLTDIIENGDVAVPTVIDNIPTVQYRDAYDFEVQQFLGRAGRYDGDQVVLWQCNQQPPKYMCDLECLEVDAANILFRLLGFRPPVELADFDFFSGNVPIDLATAITSDHPMRLCPADARVPWINGDRALLEEKKKAGYVYPTLPKKKTLRDRYVSCHTVADVEVRPPSPPPPVPAAHRVARYDTADLDNYYVDRSRSPSLSTVVTLETNSVEDAVSVLERDLAFEKPKRVAQRVLDQRAAQAAREEAAAREIEERRVAEKVAEVSVVPHGVVGTGVIAAVVSGSDGDRSSPSLLRQVTRRDPQAFGLGTLHEALRDKPSSQYVQSIGDDRLGSYVYYHGMDTAPNSSNYFWRGLETVLQFSTRDDARALTKGLPPSDRLYAMKLLVDEYNNSTAVVMGIQRLFTEVSKRPATEWKDLLDHVEFLKTVDWITERATVAQAQARLCGSVMSYFADHSLDFIPSALELEQRVMSEMMDKFELAAIKKDPDKTSEYLRMLNSRNVRIKPRRGYGT